MLIIVLASVAMESFAQEKLMDHIEHMMDHFSGEFKADSSEYPVGWVLAPIIAYAPETSLQLGIGSQLVFKPFGAGENTRPSTLEMTARYTLNNQLILSPEYRIFFNEEKYILRGEMTFEKFPQFFYGIGNDTPEENEELYEFSSFEADQILYRQLFSKMYAGFGYRFAYRYKLKLEEDGLLDNSNIPGKSGGRSGGFTLGLLYDNRNNVLNSARGTFVELSHTLHRRFTGSEFDYTLTILDARTYFQPSDERSDVLAFQVYGYFAHGNTPFTDLAALGGGRIMRGYYEGRYLDNHLLAAQAEYRLPLWRRIGAVGFVAVGEVAPQVKDFSLSGIKPSGGIGLRYKIMEKENLNLRFDVAVGKNSSGIYINISEAF